MRISSLIAGASLIVGLAACSDSSPDVTNVNASPLAGSYALKTVDGVPLPWVNPLYPADTLISLAITINDDGTWTSAAALSGGVTGGDHGTVTVSGDSATFIWTDGKPYKASLSNGSITILSGGHLDMLQPF